MKESFFRLSSLHCWLWPMPLAGWWKQKLNGPARIARRIGIYRTTYPQASESFIGRQAGAMSRYKPLLLVRTKLGPIELDHLALTAESAGSLRSVLFALTHWPGCFGSDPRFRAR